MKKLQEFNYEVYTLNPDTGETGWDIKFVSVIAPDSKTAKSYLKQWPLFDCIILHNYETPFSEEQYVEFKEGRIFDSGSYRNEENVYKLLFEANLGGE